MHLVDTYETMFTVGGLPEGITALQRLQHLRLYNCLTEPLAGGISRLSQLTSVSIISSDLHSEDNHEPGSVAVRWSFFMPVQCSSRRDMCSAAVRPCLTLLTACGNVR